MQFFNNVGNALEEGLITAQTVEEWISIAYDEEVDRTWKRSVTIQPDGTLVQFQIVALQRMVQAKLDEQAEPEPLPPVVPNPKLTPDMLDDVPEPADEEPLPDIAGEVKRRVGIISAVRKWGKPQDQIRDHRTEGVKVRCPFDTHVDHHPSTWVNTEKNLWQCGKCQSGGDVIDFYAARKYGLDSSSFHRSTDFYEIVKEMAEELGYSITRTGPRSWDIEDDEVEIPSPLPDRSEEQTVEPPARSDFEAGDDDDFFVHEPLAPSHEAAEPVTITEATMLTGIAYDPADLDDEPLEMTSARRIEWQDLPINPHTFLGEWMRFNTKYYPWVPPEYFFWLGLQAIGIAMGHETTSITGGQPLSGALMISIIGPSGHGKSTAVGQLRKMFDRIGIVKFKEDTGTGVKKLANPGSAEALVTDIRHDIEDATSDPPRRVEVGITAWMYVDEMADFASKAARKGGGNLKTNLIQLYDFVKTSDAPEKVIDEMSLGSGRRVVHDSYFTATFTTQNDAIRHLMTSVDLISGFLNRIVPVNGLPRERRRLNADPPTTFDYDDSYEHLWRRCREKKRQIPFTDDAFEFIDNNPVYAKLDRMAVDSLLARVPHLSYRVALLLAVNNNERDVDTMYVSAAAELMSSYVVGTFNDLRANVIATTNDECSNEILAFVEAWFGKSHRWPVQADYAKSYIYKKYDAETRLKGIELLVAEGRLVIIKLKSKSGRGQPKQAFVIPTGKWSAYADRHLKPGVSEDEFYA